MFKLTFKSNYLKALRERLLKWGVQTEMGFRLYAPPEIIWWHFVEFGTRSNLGPYLITPTGSKTKVVYVNNGIIHFEQQVLHPGIRPHRFVAASIPEIRALYGPAIQLIFENPEQANKYLIELGEKAKELITTNLAAVTRDRTQLAEAHPFASEYPNQAGKLKGRTASEVFEELVEVQVK